MKKNSTSTSLKIFFTAVVCSFFFHTQAQVDSVSKPMIEVPNHSVSLGVWGVIPVGLTFDYRLSKQFSLEMSLGAGFSAGLKYYLLDPTIQRWNLFTGVYTTSTQFSTQTDSLGVTSKSFQIKGHSLYFPFGASYLGRKNFQYSMETGLFVSNKRLSPMLGLMLGYRFSVDYERINNKQNTAKKRNVISLSLLGMTPLLGIVYERLLAPFIGIDVGIGFLSTGLGFKLYVPRIRDNKLNFHVGAAHYFFLFPWIGGWKTYFPIGLNYMNEDGFRISFDLGPNIGWHENIVSNYNLFFNGNLRVGMAF